MNKLPGFAKVPPTGCCHPEHQGTRRVDRHSTYWYQDKNHGFPLEGPCCRKCYAAHILKHYPKSPVADHIRRHPENYKNTYITKRRPTA